MNQLFHLLHFGKMQYNQSSGNGFIQFLPEHASLLLQELNHRKIPIEVEHRLYTKDDSLNRLYAKEFFLKENGLYVLLPTLHEAFKSQLCADATYYLSPILTLFDSNIIDLHSISLTQSPALTHLKSNPIYKKEKATMRNEPNEQESPLSPNTTPEEAVELAFKEGKLHESQRAWALAFAQENIQRFIEETKTMPPIAPVKLSQIALSFSPTKQASHMPSSSLPILKIAKLSGLSESQLSTLLKGECLHV